MVSLFSKELPFKAKAVFFCKGDVATSLLVGFSFQHFKGSMGFGPQKNWDRLRRFIWMVLFWDVHIFLIIPNNESTLEMSVNLFNFFLVNRPTQGFSDSARIELWTQERKWSAPRIAATSGREKLRQVSLSTSTLGDDFNPVERNIYIYIC